VSTADGAVPLEMITGLSGSQIEGKVMIVHQLDGGRIACGIIEAVKKVTSDGGEDGGDVSEASRMKSMQAFIGLCSIWLITCWI